MSGINAYIHQHFNFEHLKKVVIYLTLHAENYIFNNIILKSVFFLYIYYNIT